MNELKNKKTSGFIIIKMLAKRDPKTGKLKLKNKSKK